jgi:hypothetical protein
MGDRSDRRFGREHESNGHRRYSGPQQGRREYSERPHSAGQLKRKRDDFSEPRDEESRLLASLFRVGDLQDVSEDFHSHVMRHLKDAL